jgi:hypothetical protein
VTFGTGSLTAGKVYYYLSDGSWELTKADTSSTSNGMLGVALGSSPSDGLVVRGYVRNTAFTSTNAAILYLSAAVTGDLTSTQPSGSSGYIVRVIGYQINATEHIIYFNPSPDWIELA